MRLSWVCGVIGFSGDAERYREAWGRIAAFLADDERCGPHGGWVTVALEGGHTVTECVECGATWTPYDGCVLYWPPEAVEWEPT